MRTNLKRLDRVGETNISTEGYPLEIIGHNGDSDITVLIDNKYVREGVSYCVFKSGGIKNYFHRSVHGLGYVGETPFEYLTPSRLKMLRKADGVWRSMIERLVNDKDYVDCAACLAWECRAEFLPFHFEWYYTLPGEKVVLDKDIRIKGNKLYSPNTCLYVPERINKLIRRRSFKASELARGVWNTRNGKYIASIEWNGNTSLGVYNTEAEAFQVFQKAFSEKLKAVVDTYAGKIPEKTYSILKPSMYAYEVDPY